MDIARSDTTVQKMWRVHRVIAKHVAASVGGDMESIMQKVLQEACRCEADSNHGAMQELATFVRHWSGGLETPWVLMELDQFCQGLKGARNVPPVVVNRLDTLNIGISVGAEWRLGCLEAMVAAPGDPSEDSKFMAASDIMSMGSRLKPFVLQGFSVMQKGSQLIASMDPGSTLQESRKIEILGRFRIRCVAHVMQRQQAHGLGSFKSMNDIGYKMFQEVEEAMGVVYPIENVPFNRPQDPTAEEGVQPKSNPRAITALVQGGVGSVDNVEIQLASKGFKIGARCFKRDKGFEVSTIPHDIIVKDIKVEKTTVDKKEGHTLATAFVVCEVVGKDPKNTITIAPDSIMKDYIPVKEIKKDRCGVGEKLKTKNKNKTSDIL
jgi:hypothetical protein